MFDPIFKITPRISKALMKIEASRTKIEGLPITTDLLISLRNSAKLEATHFSTYIEGNKLNEEQVEAVISGQGNPGRQRDQDEVTNYYAALNETENICKASKSITNNHILLIHSMVMNGKRKKLPYREGQNAIRDSGTKAIVYMPPEAKDVPILMQELLEWTEKTIIEGEMPIPIVAAMAHYQFATIHPFYDGNGRTARLLTSLILHMNGYGLKGIYALEEYYAKNLPAYYNALTVGDSHNYYFGRAESDVTCFIDYFCLGMAESFQKVEERAFEEQRLKKIDISELLIELEPRQRQALVLFKNNHTISAIDIAQLFDIKIRRAQYICRMWSTNEFLVIKNPSKRNRAYSLPQKFKSILG